MSTIPVLPIDTSTNSARVNLNPDAELRDAAIKLEATFLSEMLKFAGLGPMKGAFSGGVGEEQFASMLRDTQAEKMVEAGGIGLAESLFEAMKARANA